MKFLSAAEKLVSIFYLERTSARIYVSQERIVLRAFEGFK